LIKVLFLLVLSFPLLAETKPNYDKANSELVIAWDKIFPLKFEKIIKEDPLKKGILREKRSDARVVWIYNFTVFMPKYDRNENDPKMREEGREILVYFLWEPGQIEDPYRIQLGELNQNL